MPSALQAGCPVCRVGMSPLSRPESPPATLDSPGPSAPQRKARSQKQVVCPRKLWQPSCLSLRASRLAAACRLRQSGHRDRGPFPPTTKPASRLPQPPSHRSCLKPVCAYAHLVYSPPFGPIAPRGGAGPLLFLGARLARVEAPGKEGGGLCPLGPPISRAKPAAAKSYGSGVRSSSRVCFESSPCPKAAGVRKAPLSALLPSAAWTAQAGSRWGRPACRCAAALLRGRSSWARPFPALLPTTADLRQCTIVLT